MNHRYMPFGYYVKEGAVTVKTEEADVIKLIFTQYVSGMSLKKIAEMLTFEKVEFLPQQYLWNKNRVARIIEDSRYTGTDVYEAIIDTETFETAQEMKLSRNTQADHDRSRVIPVIFEKEGLNTMHATSEIYIGMHGIFAQSESESLSGNVRMGKAMSAKKGVVPFSYKSFLGYRRGADNQPEIDPEEAEIVRFIFDRYLAGDSLQIIKLTLEHKGIPTPMGKSEWSVATLRSILTNEKYKGDALLQKTYVVDCITHKSKRNDDRPQYYVENNHPPIVSREVFDRVQTEMARRTSKRSVKEKGTKTESGKYSSKYALTDMLICGHCGTPYRRCTWVRKGEKKIVWRCISRLDYGKKYCPDSSTIEEGALQNAIVTCIKQVLQDESGYASIENMKRHVSLYFGKDDENSTAADEARAAELVEAITQAASAGQYTSQMQSLVDELNRVKAVIAEKKRRQSEAGQSSDRIEDIMAAIEKLKDTPMVFDNQAIRQIIACIKVVAKDEILIIFKGGLERSVKLH